MSWEWTKATRSTGLRGECWGICMLYVSAVYEYCTFTKSSSIVGVATASRRLLIRGVALYRSMRGVSVRDCMRLGGDKRSGSLWKCGTHSNGGRYSEAAPRSAFTPAEAMLTTIPGRSSALLPTNPHDLLLDANCRNLRKFASSYTDVARF